VPYIRGRVKGEGKQDTNERGRGGVEGKGEQRKGGDKDW